MKKTRSLRLPSLSHPPLGRALAGGLCALLLAGCGASLDEQMQRDVQALDQRVGDLERVNRRLVNRISSYDETVELLEDQVRSLRLATTSQHQPLPRVRITPTTRGEERAPFERRPDHAQNAAPPPPEVGFAPADEEGYVDIVISDDVVEEFLNRNPVDGGGGGGGDGGRFEARAPVVQGDRLPVTNGTPRVPRQPTPAPPTRAAGGEPIEDYKRGLKQYREGSFREAIDSFDRFLASAPPEDYVDNALYWLGDCHYGLGDYAKAASLFHKIVKEHPSANKVPDALLKVGLTYQKLNKSDSAREVMYYLIEAYPKSEAARIARDKLGEATE